jgi:antitoxin MazE
MQTRLRKWGNSIAVRIPKGILEAVHMTENDRVEIVAEDDHIIIKRAVPDKKRLDIILEGYEGGYHAQETDWGRNEGSEVW